jgi:hypothetical protein
MLNSPKSHSKLLKSLFVAGSIAVAALAAPAANASAIFGGLTFTFTQTGTNQLTFEVSGTPSDADGAGWAGVQFLGAFDLKGLGLDFTTDTATANGPGATNLAGLDAQLSASNIDCSNMSPGETGTVCFDISPDQALGTLPFDFTYVIDFSAPLNIASTGVHLQIAFTNTDGGDKVGSLYSQDVALGSSSNGGPSGSGTIPEPSSSSLALLGVALLGAAFLRRRQSMHS